MTARAKLGLLVALLIAGAHASIAVARQAPRGALTVTGRVLFLDGDPPSVYDVAVMSVDDYGVDENARILPDETGAFTSPALAPGLYRVKVFAAGYDRVKGAGEPNYVRPGDAVTVFMRRGAMITGTVTDGAGEPLGGVRVQSIRVREEDRLRLDTPEADDVGDTSDDRGVYRIYGLRAGSYLVMASRSKLDDGDGGKPTGALLPATYYPSSGRRDAKEVVVAWGEERTGVDIRCAERNGRKISGTVVWPSAPENGSLHVTLYAADGVEENDRWLDVSGPEIAFSLEVEADGEYELVAEGMNASYHSSAETRRRVVVRDGDVRGVRLQLAPVPPPIKIGGRVTVEPIDPKRSGASASDAGSVEEIGLIGVPSEVAQTSPRFGAPVASTWTVVPDASGAFDDEGEDPGIYRLGADLPADDWYVRGISRGPKGDPSVREITLAEGQKVTDLVVSIGRGAASVSGKIALLAGAEKTRPDLVIYLVPVDLTLAGNLWRYAKVSAGDDGAFYVRNLAPGTYWLLARPAPAPGEGSPIWDSAKRAALRADAEAAKQVVELAPRARAKAATVRP